MKLQIKAASIAKGISFIVLSPKGGCHRRAVMALDWFSGEFSIASFGAPSTSCTISMGRPKIFRSRSLMQFAVKSTSVAVQFVIESSSPEGCMRSAAISAFALDATRCRIPYIPRDDTAHTSTSPKNLSGSRGTAGNLLLAHACRGRRGRGRSSC